MSATLEVFADVGCPFTHLGLLRLVEERQRRERADVVLRVRAWPLELVNGRPLDAEFIAEEVDDLRAQVAPGAFANFQQSAFPNSTLPAMCLVAAAGDNLELAETLSLEVRTALFEDGLNVANPDVLAAIAARHQMRWKGDTDQLAELTEVIHDDWEEGRRRGVIGSPHFFTPSGGFFCPALDVGRDHQGHLKVHEDPEGFESFVAEVFSHP